MPLVHRARLLSAFGRRVRKLRQAKGITPSVFEAISGINPGNLAKYEKGEREPGLAIIMLIAWSLNVSHLTLLDFAFNLDAPVN
jgi:transcriptional regulator with XRE-family HTH domain